VEKYLIIFSIHRTARGRVRADAALAFHGLRGDSGLVAAESGIAAESQFRVLATRRVAGVADVAVTVANIIAHRPQQTRSR